MTAVAARRASWDTVRRSPVSHLPAGAVPGAVVIPGTAKSAHGAWQNTQPQS